MVPSANGIKYLGLTFDKIPVWSVHLKQKRKEVNFRSLTNKVTVYITINNPPGPALQNPTFKDGKAIQHQNPRSVSINMPSPNYVCPLELTNKNLRLELKLTILNNLMKS